MSKPRLAALLQNLNNWTVDSGHLSKQYNFTDFKTGLDFVNRIGKVAEEQDHHPDIFLTWGKVRLEFWTHKINGLTKNDFIMADKCDVEFSRRSSKDAR